MPLLISLSAILPAGVVSVLVAWHKYLVRDCSTAPRWQERTLAHSALHRMHMESDTASLTRAPQKLLAYMRKYTIIACRFNWDGCNHWAGKLSPDGSEACQPARYANTTPPRSPLKELLAVVSLNPSGIGADAMRFLASSYMFLLRRYELQHTRLLAINIILFILCTAQSTCIILVKFATENSESLDIQRLGGKKHTRATSCWISITCQIQLQTSLQMDCLWVLATSASDIDDNFPTLIRYGDAIRYGSTEAQLWPYPPLSFWQKQTPVSSAACGMAVFVTGVMMTKIQYHMRPTESLPEPLWDRLNRTASNANTAYWAASFIVNSIMTILIGARIWWQTRGYSDSSIKIEGRKHIRVTLIILESGAVYSLLFFLSVIFTALSDDSFGQIPAGIPCRNILGEAESDARDRLIHFSRLMAKLSISVPPSDEEIKGIFPTAILVLVGLRLAVEKVTRKVEGTFSMPVLGTMPTRL
ncbi:hypothetical protein GLOTRDRAFT_95107 [Gloeophyllum trabeum ATCC 11539]|uniref:Uncharacterized protein n=1 Tax=Gloeophyllum trabeum (strain ATCC 11539 / FP-39264 / Madison 617) TaxID=670483 RepID=S7Q049_GLOTA|nr:uncharacterized protein GLOTRDRAFT_95107 [Gloeophyllum trabeum ATCC 11539]EPQ53068.1 hypothetical protein GLOTRDRAFT_95107 [Gloeophyllum trabeum ATCC 11539]